MGWIRGISEELVSISSKNGLIINNWSLFGNYRGYFFMMGTILNPLTPVLSLPTSGHYYEQAI